MINRLVENKVVRDCEKQLEMKRKKVVLSKMSLINNKVHNRINNVLKPIKIMQVDKGIIYEIVSPFMKDRMFFKCIRPGILKIKYFYNAKMKKDILSFDGTAKMLYEQEITEGMNND